MANASSVRSVPDTTVGQFRPEIQALRALAVILVVLFHLWPQRLTGGFVGVDVFFAISGYLITGHLLRDAARTRRISLAPFWARRVRRLLPAAFLVLAASLIATVALLPERVWQFTAQQIAASALGFENWALTASSVGYFTADQQATLVQHYWSLSLEEQFYLVWPVLLLVVYALARRREIRVLTIALGALMGGVALASLTWSIVDTATDRTGAYFSTLTHAWEFALGGILALGFTRLFRTAWAGMHRTRAITTWVGLAAILTASITFSGASAFPGWIAVLPIAGTLLVIAAGASESRIHPRWLVSSRAVQLTGGASYSIYLWHWPLIVVAPYVLGHALGTSSKIVILVLALGLGLLTRVFVEDPARRSRLLGSRLWLNYVLLPIAAGSVAIASLGIGVVATNTERASEHHAEQALQAALAHASSCLGAAAMTSAAPCADLHTVRAGFGPDFAAGDWGALAAIDKDGTLPDKSACVDFSGTGAGYLDCTLGDPNSGTTLAIVGDSHALALFEPLLAIAQSRGWKVRGFLENNCSASLPILYRTPAKHASCNLWRTAVEKRIANDPTISMVVTTGFTRGRTDVGYAESHAALEAGYAGLWQKWTSTGKRVFAIEDVPRSAGQSVPDCIAASPQRVDPCSVPRARALAFDPVVGAAHVGNPGVTLISLTDLMCDTTTCHSVIGGLIVYRDFHHLTGSFALTLMPFLARALPSTR
jgi:peptidoglycan/LPS O-acetylase OafA/YrhL